MRLYDLSPTLNEKTGVFPGDVGFKRQVAMSFEAGHHLDLSSISTTLHIGSHADAPSHYAAAGVTIDRRDPSLYMGTARVFRADVKKGERVGLRHLSAEAQAAIQAGRGLAKRVLFYTGTFPNPNEWNSDFASLEPDLIERLAKAGVRLVGIDTPSVDPETSKRLESHAMIAQNDMAILEGICLEGVPEGLYTLIAPPLKLAGADSGPVRAFLLDRILEPLDSNMMWVECEPK
jgi:arylformamidase